MKLVVSKKKKQELQADKQVDKRLFKVLAESSLITLPQFASIMTGLKNPPTKVVATYASGNVILTNIKRWQREHNLFGVRVNKHAFDRKIGLEQQVPASIPDAARFLAGGKRAKSWGGPTAGIYFSNGSDGGFVFLAKALYKKFVAEGQAKREHEETKAFLAAHSEHVNPDAVADYKARRFHSSEESAKDKNAA